MTCPWSLWQLVTELKLEAGLPTPGSVTDKLSRLLLTGLKSCLLFRAWFLPENVFWVPNQHTAGKMRNTAHSVLETTTVRPPAPSKVCLSWLAGGGEVGSESEKRCYPWTDLPNRRTFTV